MSDNQNPEQHARDRIDAQLRAAGWAVQKKIDFSAGLGQAVRDHGYALSLSDDHTYTRYRVFRGHYDFATSTGFEIERITTLPQGASDHRPILVTVKPD